MNCVEAQEVLPEVIDGSQNIEVQAHLKSCPVCSELVSDLQLIASEARRLSEADQPADRVWVRISAEVRAEGLIPGTEAVPARPGLVPQAGKSRDGWGAVATAAGLPS